MTGPQMPGDTIGEVLRKRFEFAWLEGRPEPIERLLPAEEDPRYLTILEELVQIELALAWKSWSKAGQPGSAAPQDETVARPLPVEHYLERFARLNQPEIVLRLLQQECSVRKQYGEDASVEEYRRRFPDLAIADGQFESTLPVVSKSSRDVPAAETLTNGQLGGATVAGVESEQFGNYESLEEIGRGGMGVVYRARQRTADRIVALKVIRRDRLESLPRDTHTNAIERFRLEAQAAAKLEHENIVTVYEVGEVDQQPFFSMRYVDGRSLAAILREGPMENRRAAGYLEPVARAVHEAHCKGILHRDLKPQNILVDSKTDRALVADFGLAKLAEGNEELTRSGEVMGTPSYMSPEQAKDSGRVTAKSDVYALGATLYSVLTSRPPFQAGTLVATLRQVIDEEPVPPRRLNPSIDRDLETICLKCLQKEPSRRYDSAHALADDLRRYLKREPILARPIGTAGRSLRWCRRNPVVATLAALTTTFLVVALVVSLVGYRKTSAALKQSEKSLDHSRNTVRDFYTDVSQNRLFNLPGMQPLRRELLAKAREYYQQILKQRGNDPKSRDLLAEAHFHVGRITEEIESPEEALKSYRLARDMQKQLVSERPNDPEYLQALGNTLNAIATALHGLEKLDEALQSHGEAIKYRRQLAEAAPKEAEFRRKLANSHMNIGLVEKDRGRYEEARRRFEEAQAVRMKLLREDPDDPKARRDLGMGYFNLANLALIVADAERAQQNLEEAIQVFEELLESDPGDLRNQSHLAICHRILADLKSQMGDMDSAMGDYQKALERLQTLADRNPAVPDYQADLAGLHMNLGQLNYEQQQPAAALKSFQRAAELLKTLVKEYGEVPGYRRDYAVTLGAVARLQHDGGEQQQARGNLATAIRHLSELVRQFPQNDEFKNELDNTQALLRELDVAQPQEE